MQEVLKQLAAHVEPLKELTEQLREQTEGTFLGPHRAFWLDKLREAVHLFEDAVEELES